MHDGASLEQRRARRHPFLHHEQSAVLGIVGDARYLLAARRDDIALKGEDLIGLDFGRQAHARSDFGEVRRVIQSNLWSRRSDRSLRAESTGDIGFDVGRVARKSDGVAVI